jgi:hypothetical protein
MLIRELKILKTKINIKYIMQNTQQYSRDIFDFHVKYRYNNFIEVNLLSIQNKAKARRKVYVLERKSEKASY